MADLDLTFVDFKRQQRTVTVPLGENEYAAWSEMKNAVDKAWGSPLPAGAPKNVVRTVTENGRTLKFNSQGFEKD